MERREIFRYAALALVFSIAVIIALGPVMSTIQSNRTINNNGSIKAIGVALYSDQAGTTPLSSISWGTIEPGSSVSKTVYVKNTGNNAVALSLATANWNPSNAQSYMPLSWNYSGQLINPNAISPVTLTLSASSTISGITNFSFDVTITATG